MPRISTGPFGIAKKFVCDRCGLSFGRRNDLARHEKAHNPNADRFKCPHEDCGYSALQKSNVTNHMNARHTQDRRYNCRFDPLCPKSYVDPSARIRHEKKRHNHNHKSLQEANKISLRGETGIEEPLASGPPDEITMEAECFDRAALVNAPCTGNKVLGHADQTQKLNMIPPSSNSLSPLTTSFDNLRLRDLHPMPSASAERPTLPGVQAIMAQCPGYSAYSPATQNFFSSRTLPPLQPSSIRPLSKYTAAHASSSPSFAGATQSSRGYDSQTNSLTSQLSNDSRLKGILLRRKEAKVIKNGKEYLVSFQTTIRENK